jgi:hypothetical protein
VQRAWVVQNSHSGMNRPPPAPADPAGDRQPHRLRRKGPDPRTRLDQHFQRDPRPRCSQRCEACSSLVGSRATRSLTGGPSQVDMLLLAGDLFHENRPSRTSLYQTISAMRERCLGDRPISLELISDAGVGIARDARCARTNPPAGALLESVCTSKNGIWTDPRRRPRAQLAGNQLRRRKHQRRAARLFDSREPRRPAGRRHGAEGSFSATIHGDLFTDPGRAFAHCRKAPSARSTSCPRPG